MDIGVEIISDRRALLRFDEFPDQARVQLKDVITRAAAQLRDMAEARVPKRTGKLASEIDMQVLDYPDRITGLVGVRGDTHNEMAKAAAEEYGAHGTTEVKTHAARLEHFFGRHVEAMEVTVTAHSRKLNIKATEFLRDPLRQIGPGVLDEMREALNAAATEASDV